MSRHRKLSKKKERRNVASAVVWVHATFNNTKVSFCDLHGDLLCWATAGSVGYKGARKGTSLAGQVAAEEAVQKALEFGVVTILELNLVGPGGSRESVARAIAAGGFHIIHIKDATPIPHNGSRPPKARRV